MTKFWRYIAPVILLAVFLLMPKTARASTQDFTINDFTGDYYLTKNDPQGSLHIVEHIDLTFNDFNHGILRAIPDSYKSHSLKIHINKVSSDSEAPVQFSTYGDSGNTVLKIGDPSRTITGKQSYTIDYNVDNVVSFYNDHDELYWDINGDQWLQPFEHVTARFHIPSGLSVNQQACYTGAYGVTSQNCTIKPEGDGIVAETTSPLTAQETLTAIMAFPKGYFVAPTFADWWHDNYDKVFEVALTPLIVGGVAFMYWRKRGKDIKGRGVIIPEYQPPSEVSPAEAGVILAYKLNARDVSATIIDLAIRKYLRISETTEKKLLRDKKAYSLELLNNNWEGLKSHEVQVLNDIFTATKIKIGFSMTALKSLQNSLNEAISASQQAAEVGKVVSLKELNGVFYQTIQSLQNTLPKELTAAGYFPYNPKYVGVGMYIISVVLVILGFALIGLISWGATGLFIAASLVLIFGLLMTKRTTKGVEAKEALDGLKLYMTVAEKDRIKMLQSPDSPYASKSDMPKQTVELYEKLLPYAIVMGVEKQWAKKFEDIYKTPPDWYNGNWGTFNTLYLTASLSSSISAMSSSFSPPRSSGSSGFGGGGGGFSGGGGGGGGGGGW